MKKFILFLVVLVPVFLLSSADASCYDTLGLMSVDNYDGTCSCMIGYMMTPKSYGGGYECISKNTYCSNEYGFSASYDSLSDSCTCGYGSVWGTDMFGNTSCVSGNTACYDQYGFSSSYNSLSGKCKCSYGYVFSTDMFGNTSCVSGNTACHDQLGYNSSYESFSKSCICDDGYTIIDGKCEKKAYSTYGILKELKNDTAIVVFNKPNSTFESYYEIDFSLGCRDVEEYVGEVIVLNLMYDQRLNYGDYLVLPESKDYDGDSQHCKITSTIEVDEDGTLYDAPTNNYVNSNNYINTQTISYTQNNEEISTAINWMYSNGLTSFNTIGSFRPNDNLTREQASKFFAEFAEKIVGLTVDISKSPNFTDTTNADSTLKAYIIKSYQMGIFLGNNGKFLPFDKLTKAEALTVLSRIMFGDAYNKGRSTWYAGHFNIAEMSGVLTNMGFSIQSVENSFVTRGEAALLIYRYYNTYSE